MPPKSGFKGATLAGVLIVVAAAAAFPVYYATNAGKPSLSGKPLNTDATIRGVYINAGSKDIGLDPNAGKLLHPLDAAARSLAAVAASLSLALLTPALPAGAVLNSPVAQVPRTVGAALRRSIPAFNENIAAIQGNLEDVQFRLRIPQRKPWGDMAQTMAITEKLAADDVAMMRGILPRDADTGSDLIADLREDLSRVAAAVGVKDATRTSTRVANALERVSALELLQAPGLPFPIPAQYSSLPRLTGRALVELTFEKRGGGADFVEPDSELGPQKQATLELTLDGYSAPITAGNFAKNVLDGVYDGKRLVANRDSVLIGDQGKAIGALPLEIMQAGDFEPVYRLPLEVRSGELPALPLSIYGSAAMTHLPGADASVGFVSSRQFFLYKYQRQSSGLAGLSFDEGNFGVFGYITKGRDLLPRLEDGDLLVSAKLVLGADKLVQPQQTVEASN